MLNGSMPAGDEEPVIVWVKPGQSKEAALSERFGFGARPADVIFVGGDLAAGELLPTRPLWPYRTVD